MIDFNTWMERSYKQLDCRYPTMFKALETLNNNTDSPIIVETGCQRLKNDWGGGQSTKVFSDFLKNIKNAGHLYSVDISEHNVNVCRNVTKEYEEFRSVFCSDSVVFLEGLQNKNVAAFPNVETIDLLYLDSWDYPIIEIADMYGPRSEFVSTLEMLKEMGDEVLIKTHGDLIIPCQEHCLKEIKAGLSLLNKKSIVLIDDVNFPGGGKSRLAEEFLAENGWKCILRNQQSLWLRK